MATPFHPQDTLGDIVARFPGAADLFIDNQIDFCCGGKRTLAQAAAERGIDVDALIRELEARYRQANAAASSDTDWRRAPVAELLDHIVNTHHAYLNTTLRPLGELVTTVLRVHGARHPELAQVHRLFHELKTDLEQHLIQEETQVFPRIHAWVAGESTEDPGTIAQAMAELEADHDRAGDLLKAIRTATTDYALPEDACATYQYVFDKLQELERNTYLHVHLENNVLFPKLTAAGSV